MRAVILAGLVVTANTMLFACDSSDSGTTNTDAGVDATTSDSDVSSAPPSIACGASSCDPASEVCCLFQNANKCQKTADCKGAFLGCTRSSTCKTGEVCCGIASSGGFHSECTASCPSNNKRMCETAKDCNAGESCTSPGNPLLNFCGAPGTGDGGCPPPPPPDSGVPPPPCPDGG